MLLGIPEGSGELAIKGIYGWENFEIKLRETCIRFLMVKIITFKCFLTSLKFVLPGMLSLPLDMCSLYGHVLHSYKWWPFPCVCGPACGYFFNLIFFLGYSVELFGIQSNCSVTETILDKQFSPPLLVNVTPKLPLVQFQCGIDDVKSFINSSHRGSSLTLEVKIYRGQR